MIHSVHPTCSALPACSSHPPTSSSCSSLLSHLLVWSGVVHTRAARRHHGQHLLSHLRYRFRSNPGHPQLLTSSQRYVLSLPHFSPWLHQSLAVPFRSPVFSFFPSPVLPPPRPATPQKPPFPPGRASLPKPHGPLKDPGRRQGGVRRSASHVSPDFVAAHRSQPGRHSAAAAHPDARALPNPDPDRRVRSMRH